MAAIYPLVMYLMYHTVYDPIINELMSDTLVFRTLSRHFIQNRVVVKVN